MKSYFFLIIPLLLFLSCQEEEAPQRPNILFAIADDQSFPHAGAYGCTWIETPAFDKVAKKGLLFTQAFTPNAKCAPSRACILTGRNSWQLEEAANHWCVFPEKFTTFPEVLSKNGYEVGRTGKGWAPGVAMKNGEPRELIGKVFNDHKLTPPAGYISPLDYAENFKQFLGERKADAPFMFWYGGFEPHRAYEFQAGMKKGNKVLSEIDSVPPFWPDTDTVRADMLDYAYEVEYFDQQLGKMLEVLEEQGLLENTIVIVTSDN
ncbi:MAG: sulfatase-like hydrolase/transferase, partial [Bacteroidota bacterium]